jgi:hypothetical protein
MCKPDPNQGYVDARLFRRPFAQQFRWVFCFVMSNSHTRRGSLTRALTWRSGSQPCASLRVCIFSLRKVSINIFFGATDVLLEHGWIFYCCRVSCGQDPCFLAPTRGSWPADVLREAKSSRARRTSVVEVRISSADSEPRLFGTATFRLLLAR